MFPHVWQEGAPMRRRYSTPKIYATFESFLHSCRVMPNVRGDIILTLRDLIKTGQLPEPKIWGEIARCVRVNGYGDEAMVEARELWKQFQKQLNPENVS
jgi:hypothetical protein